MNFSLLRQGRLSLQDETMKRLMQSVAGLVVAISLAGCCCTQGYVDPNTGIGYGGGWEPCGFVDPFSIIFGSCGLFAGCGCGPCHVGPATPCAPGCAPGCSPTPVVGSYDGAVHSSPVIHTESHHTTESIPAGIYEEATPEPKVVPEPKPAKTGSIIYQTRPAGSHHRAPQRDARNSQWVPARI